MNDRTELPTDAQGEGRKERFRVLAEAQLPRLYSVARRLAGSQAEDAVQEALLRAYRAFDTLTDPATGAGWMMAILVNVCRDRARADARRPREVDIDDAESFSLFRTIADEDPLPYSDTLHLDFLQAFGTEDVREVLLRLPLLYRTPLVLVHMQGFSTKEVARMLDMPLGTVLARLHRGRKLFERTLWEYAEENELLREGAAP